MSAGRHAGDALDRYDTPADVTRAFLVAYGAATRWWPGDVPPTIWEPAAGRGAMLEPLREFFPGASVYASDVRPRCDGVVPLDFFDLSAIAADLIITNPPFGLAEQFLRRAMERVAHDGTVIFLMRAAFLESQRRAALLDEYPPAEVYFLRRRPHFTGPNTNGAGTDAAMYAWFVWRKGERPEHFEGRII